MILSQLICPVCKIPFNDRMFVKQLKNTIQLDQIYHYNYLQLFCPHCKQQICVFDYNKPILWRKSDQYSYGQFLKISKNTKMLNKKFLYLYYPCTQQFIIDGLCKYIDFDKFDAIITTQDFENRLKNIDKQLCIIPNYLFSHLKNNLMPNYFIQRIIIRQSQKFDQPILCSSYFTFFNCFHIIYKQKNWNLIKKYLNK